MCCFWVRNMPESWEKWNKSRMRWSKTYKLGTFALTAVKLQMFGSKACHVWHPIRTCFFCVVSTFRCNWWYCKLWRPSEWAKDLTEVQMRKYLVTKQFKRRILRHFWVFAVNFDFPIDWFSYCIYCVVSAHSETLQ